MDWYFKVLKQYSDFHGRARRQEYWMFILFNIGFGGAARLVDNILGLKIESIGIGPFYIVYGLFVLVPSVAVTVRRLHDIGKSGYMILVSLIPILGLIWLIILNATEGIVGPNKYGADPKH